MPLELESAITSLIQSSPFAVAGWRIAVHFMNKQEATVRELIDAFKSEAERCHERNGKLEDRILHLEVREHENPLH